MADGSGVARYEISSPELLAETPAIAVAPLREARRVEKWQVTLNHLETRLNAMRSWRLSWWIHWSRLAENILPRRYHWLITPNTMTRGQELNQAILDPTGTQAMRICAAGMMNGLTSPDRPWFKLTVQISNYQPDEDAVAWFEEVESRVYAVMAGSNFYDSLIQCFEDLVVFGTGPMLIYEDPRDIIRCYNPCAGEYYLDVGGNLRVESFYRTFTLNTIQLVDWFGLENVPPEVQQLWQGKGAQLQTEQVVAHAIEPNFPIDDMNGNKVGVVPGGYAFREIYWLWGKSGQAPMSVRGFNEQPFIAPRWATTSNDPYGRSPGMDALPDILQLQRMTARLAEAIEKQVRPPMQASVELKNEPASILPGAITYVTDINKGGMKPIYEVVPQVQEMAALVQQIQNRIGRWFFNDLFMMVSQMEGVQPRNEMELSERKGEKLQALGPVIGKFQNEGASMAIARIIRIMGRRGLIPPKPRSLLGQPIGVQYESINTMAQRAASTASMERVVMMAGRMEGAWQGTIDNIQPDRFLRDYASKLSFPSRDLSTPKEQTQIRTARQQQMASALKTQAATTVLPTAVEAAKNMSQTNVGGGMNALQALIGGGQGQ